MLVLYGFDGCRCAARSSGFGGSDGADGGCAERRRGEGI